MVIYWIFFKKYGVYFTGEQQNFEPLGTELLYKLELAQGQKNVITKDVSDKQGRQRGNETAH